MNSAFSALKEHWRLKKTHSSENCRTSYARNEAQNLFLFKNLGFSTGENEEWAFFIYLFT